MSNSAAWFLIGLAVPVISILAGLMIARAMSINTPPDAADDTRIDQIIRAADAEQERRRVRAGDVA